MSESVEISSPWDNRATTSIYSIASKILLDSKLRLNSGEKRERSKECVSITLWSQGMICIENLKPTLP
jgi:hypothetical protein